jgi:hypothetical protein
MQYVGGRWLMKVFHYTIEVQKEMNETIKMLEESLKRKIRSFAGI